MLFVSPEAVRRFCSLETSSLECPIAASNISQSALGNDRPQESEFLEYLGNLYEPFARFSIGQKEQAKKQWADLTDYGSGIYLLLTETDGYSIWTLIDRPNGSMNLPLVEHTIEQSPSVSLQPLVILLLQTFWLAIEDLAGADRVRAFGCDLLANSQIGIEQAADLQDYLRQKSLPPTDHLWQPGAAIVAEFTNLAARYVGRNCAEQIRTTLLETAIV
jgi:hypothetical protein